MSGASKDAEEFAQDWYAILECEVTATKEQINKAARKLAMKYHPDKTTDPEAPEKFLKVQKAKEILLDEGKRKTIDDHRNAQAKRQAYESDRNKGMDARRKRMRDDLNERMKQANEPRKPTQAEANDAEGRKRAKVISELRKKSSDLMEESRDAANDQEKQKNRDFLNYRKAAESSGTQVKVKWRRSSQSHSDDSLYQLFKPFGSLEDTALLGSKGTSGLITFTDAASAQAAVDFYRDSEELRVSLLSDEEKSVFAPRPQQSELSKDIRRAVEKNNLLDILGKFKKPFGEAAGQEGAGAGVGQAGLGAEAGAGAESRTDTDKVFGKAGVSASALASKETDVLGQMMEAARRRKQQQAEAKQKLAEAV
mmetsp:Transcript_14099/g.30920  ORF Transcript_14099/g.30920 Transcript_14099/m.30920 type:complete len:367 (+) Transcript_14099:75-1175(+)